MPRRAIHEYLTWIAAGLEFAERSFAYDDPVVAEDLYLVERSPQARRRTLPCSGVAYEQVARTTGADDADAVQFDGALLREAVHDQEFVEGVAQGLGHVAKPRETLFIHLERCR